MKISIIGPGIMPIPPTGWGAVEILIWDYYQELTKLGHEIQIVNTPNPNEIISEIESFKPDFVHCQYDNFYHILDKLTCPNIGITSHYGYLEAHFPNYMGYNHIMQGFLKGNFKILCLSENIKNIYSRLGVPDSRLFVTPNGARKDMFRFDENCLYPNRSIFLAKITPRKRQTLVQGIDSLYFAGNREDHRFNYNSPNYLGEWSKDVLYNELTNYANLVLLSDGEADPLVTKEALMAGLGLVISEYSTANLDTSLPYIDVIPESKIGDINYVKEIIEKNRQVSVKMRNEIRDYAINNLDWGVIAKDYSNLIESTVK
jgi:glycosyltransferase involved in cell wall biosynthesis